MDGWRDADIGDRPGSPGRPAAADAPRSGASGLVGAPVAGGGRRFGLRGRFLRLLMAAVLAILAAGHVYYWYLPRERAIVPPPPAGGAPLDGLAAGDYDLCVWIPYPHQNLGALAGAVADLPEVLAAAVRLSRGEGAPAADEADASQAADAAGTGGAVGGRARDRGGRDPLVIPQFGPFEVPPANEIVACTDLAGGRLHVAARVYPALALIARAAGHLAGNPWLTGGAVGRMRIRWDGRLWSVTAGDERRPAAGGVVAPPADLEQPRRLPASLAVIRWAGRRAEVPAGWYALTREEGDLVLELVRRAAGGAAAESAAAPPPSVAVAAARWFPPSAAGPGATAAPGAADAGGDAGVGDASDASDTGDAGAAGAAGAAGDAGDGASRGGRPALVVAVGADWRGTLPFGGAGGSHDARPRAAADFDPTKPMWTGYPRPAEPAGVPNPRHSANGGDASARQPGSPGQSATASPTAPSPATDLSSAPRTPGAATPPSQPAVAAAASGNPQPAAALALFESGSSRLSELGDIPGLAVFSPAGAAGHERWGLPAAGVFRLAARRLPTADAAGWHIVGLDPGSLRQATALAAPLAALVPPDAAPGGTAAGGAIGPTGLSGPTGPTGLTGLSLGVWFDPRTTLGIVTRIRAFVDSFPLATDREAQLWRDWQTVLDPLGRCDRSILTATTTPPSLRLVIQGCTSVIPHREPKDDG